jgi:hypothetical protein
VWVESNSGKKGNACLSYVKVIKKGKEEEEVILVVSSPCFEHSSLRLLTGLAESLTEFSILRGRGKF